MVATAELNRRSLAVEFSTLETRALLDAFGNRVEEAPIDGTQYARQDGGWVAVVGGAGTLIQPTFEVDWRPDVIVAGSSSRATARVAASCTITGWEIVGDGSTGSVVIDIWKDSYANFPPTVADTITAAAKPTVTAATKATSTTLTGWTTSLTAGDQLTFNIDSVSTFTWLRLTLFVS